MDVLLCEDVENLGWYGEVVKVSEGYARNYLLPQRLAIAPSEAKIKAMAEEKTKRDQQRKVVIDNFRKAADAVEGAEAVLAAKANEQGHLFGSITEREIAENLRGQGFAVEDKFVRLEEHIKEVGQHDVKLRFAQDIFATVKVTVVPEAQAQSTEAKDAPNQGQTEQE
ncbi:MAG: 50S ribosomal protein L9 [Planctomycetes bacterium GWF2_41_51]|nr:MAG: 50S ribosomal protein L9 [Planctomycetes bacterium GWF2_41_51]HBG27379.1 50S ribosomal protein L9 [Phycisphaerales bacterium]